MKNSLIRCINLHKNALLCKSIPKTVDLLLDPMYIPSQKCENCHFYAKEYAKTAFTIELFCFLSLGVPKFRLPRFPPKKFYNIDLITELDDGLMCSGGPTYLPTYLFLGINSRNIYCGPSLYCYAQRGSCVIQKKKA